MRTILLLALILTLGACSESDLGSASSDDISQQYSGGSPVAMMAEASMPAPAALSKAAPPSSMVLDRSKFNGRRIAETHNMQIQTPYDALQTRFQRDYAKCIELGCEVYSSNVQLEQGGQINARIAPEKLGAYLDFLADGPGKILNHSVSADDQTVAYSDTKAQMDNLLALRERLKGLLASRETAKIQDILAIEQELTRVQTEIDSRTQRLRILEQISDMATVNLSYNVEYRPIEAQQHSLANTWDNTVNNFYDAVDNVVRFIGGVLPWLPIVFGGFWLVIRMFRFAFARVTFPWPSRWKKGPGGPV